MQNKNRGAAMVEFAIVAPFFFMLISCIIYGAMVMHDINSLNEITLRLCYCKRCNTC